MDGGDGSSFTFPSTSDYPRGQDATDISWADIFLDGIHSDESGVAEAGGLSADTSGLGASIHGSTQQLLHQAQPSVVGGHLQIHIPAHLRGSLTGSTVQQAGTNICGTVAYLTPSVSTQQQVGSTGRIQNVVAVAGQHQVGASVGQQQHQGNAKLVQIASSFPMASVQQLTNSMLLQPNQTLTGQAIYGGQGTSLFPAQGSVHIENPKVVNVNFGPHVIGSDGSGQQAIIQTAEGKRVLITNSQLQHIPQSISLTQPLVGTQLISSAGGNVIRASMAPGTHTIMPASSTGAQQIVLPSGQTVIPRQTNNTQGGMSKNVVLRPLNSNMSSVIYQTGQGGQLIHSQPTLITSSGGGLQVVNTGGGQGGQVQLIAQPSINQAGIGQQQLSQGTIMSLINNQGVISGTGNQLAGLVPGQNIFVNGQMLNIGQLSGLTVPQLQVQHNPQGGVTLTNINAAMAQTAHFQPAAQQLVIQHSGQQQQVLLQPKSTQSPSIIANTAPLQRLTTCQSAGKNTPTPTSNANSASSTPVLTPTPSTPTPTPTPDLMSDSWDSGGKSNQGINILERALAMSAIDLQSFEDDFNFLDNSDCFPSESTPPTSVTPTPPLPKPNLQPTKTRSKSTKSKPKTVQPIVNVTVNSSAVSFQQPTAQIQNAQGQKLTISPQQKIITANGQVFVLSANGQQFILQPSASSANSVTSQLKPIASVASSANSINRTNISISTGSQLQFKELSQPVVSQNNFVSSTGGQFKLTPLSGSVQQKYSPMATNDGKLFIKASPDVSGTFKIETAIQSIPATQIMFTGVASNNFSPSTVSQTSLSQTLTGQNETQMLQGKNKTITTLSGTFLKQEPLEPAVKQEPVTELLESIAHAQNLPNATLSMMNLTHTSLAATTSSITAVSTPSVISSGSFTASTITSTTQSHQVTIMSTAQMAGSRQTYVSATGAGLLYSSPVSDRLQSNSICQSQSTSTSLHSTTSISSPTISSLSTSLKPNSKEKDQANIKSMISIKIADSTLMLSLTPGQKERLESELSRMSKKDQEELLEHQQNIIRRSQQVQQKQLEQHMKQQQKRFLQQQQQQHLQQPQETQQVQRDQAQQPQHISQPQLVLQQQLHGQTVSPAIMMSQASLVINRSELLSSQTGQPGPGFPTTIQELIDKPEEQDTQQSFQSFSAMKLQEQSQKMHQTSSLQQSQLPVLQQQQQHMHQSLQQRVPSLENGLGTVQQFMVPQLGRCLAEQQLLRDRSLALSPDVHTSFKSLSDAMRRLVRYHTLQDHKPEESSKTMKTWDTRYSKLCDYLVKKKRCYIRRFRKMQLYNDMCSNKRPENIQNLMCFNEQLRELIENEKERVKTNPGLFEPMSHGHIPIIHKCPAITVKPSIVDTGVEEQVSIESKGESGAHMFKMEYFGVSEPPSSEISIDPDLRSEKLQSPFASPFCQKRKLPDKGSTGTLKLVLKRRTTDNFVVKKSLIDAENLVQKLKPVVNLERSGSEYEFNSQTGNAACNPPVVVSRRTLSDAGSDNSSCISQTDKLQHHLSVEEDFEEEGGGNNEEVDDEDEEVEKSSEDDDDDGGEQSSKSKYSISIGDEVLDNSMDNDDDDSCSVSADAFMETDEVILENETLPHCKLDTARDLDHALFRYSDKNEASLESIGSKKKSHVLPNNSVISHDVCNSSLSYPPLVNSSPAKEYGRVYSKMKSVRPSAFPFENSAIEVSNSFRQSSATSLSTQEEEYISESSLSTVEKEAARKDLPSSSLFTTPNKSLLETDDMFNSDEEEEIRSSRRIVSTFEIDNKDPQSSMINDSVRSAINSVLDGDDDDDNEDSQTSWASAAHIPSSSSSSVHRNLFHSTSSSSIPLGHDADLDAAVQSILNS